MPEPDGSSTNRGTAPQLGARVMGLVDATLAIGAQLTRTVAQATTDEKLPATTSRPVEDIFTFGATAAGNLIRFVVDGGRAATASRRQRAGESSKASSGAPAGSAEPQSSPKVTAGSTLRLPLLVENTSQEPTGELDFRVVSIETPTVQEADRVALSSDAVAFAPETLRVGPKDFEKLTVRISTTPLTVPGSYRVVIAGGDNWFTTVIDFAVLV